MKKIRIGTRGSRLALVQAALVQEAVRRAGGEIETELVILHTRGDKILDRALAEIGDKGLFVSEFEQALLEDRIDLAVHSAKDLPVRLAAGLEIAAVLPRADVRDVLVVQKGGRLPKGFLGSEPHLESGGPFVLGTGSRRRQVQAELLWDDVSCALIRGNVETRLKKLAEGRYDGILLAKAGLDRLNINAQTDQRFDFHALCPQEFLPAACQGIIAVEARTGAACKELLSQISAEETWLDYLVEQEALARLEADCSEAAAAWSRQQDGSLRLDVMYGEKKVSLCGSADQKAGLELAKRAAELVRHDSAL